MPSSALRHVMAHLLAFRRLIPGLLVATAVVGLAAPGAVAHAVGFVAAPLVGCLREKREQFTGASPDSSPSRPDHPCSACPRPCVSLFYFLGLFGIILVIIWKQNIQNMFISQV